MMCIRWRCRACDTEWEDDSTPDACIRCDSGLPPNVAKTDLDRDAEIADLRAQLAAREAEIARLTQRITEQADEIQRLTGYTLAEHKTPRSRAQRINDLASTGAFVIHAARLAMHDQSVYTGRLSAVESPSRTALLRTLSVNEARGLAAAVVEAEG